jgi:hypothetical protein
MNIDALRAEIKADTHAARVRDYGEEDAASYEQRVREGADMPLTDLPDGVDPNAEFANPSYRERKPQNHGTYQVWQEGKIHAVNVESTNVRDVAELTKQPPERWKDRPDVAVLVDNPRSTELGDVIVDPTCGAWEVRDDGYFVVEPPAIVAERMAREGIVPEYVQVLKEWTKDALEYPGSDPTKESLIAEMYRLDREIGYAEFWKQCFEDPDALREWLDPIAWGELRTWWEAGGDYAAYRREFAEVGNEQLAEYRDSLAGRLAATQSKHMNDGNGTVDRGRASTQSDYEKALDAAADRGSNESKRKEGPER